MKTQIGRMEGKVAIVTGSGSRGNTVGNGQAVATIFARNGARVLLVDSVEENAHRTLDGIKSEGGEASVFVGDVVCEDTCRAITDEAIGRYGTLDVLHNNVGIGGSGTVVEADPDDWDNVMLVNVKSVMLTNKYAVSAMASGGGGSTINISSISAIRPRGLTPYTVSKGGVIALTKAMAVDHAKDGIRVNCILPGPGYSFMTAPDMSQERRDARRKASPLGTEGTPWDIAMAATFLVSDESKWVTGVILKVDGGGTLLSPDR